MKEHQPQVLKADEAQKVQYCIPLWMRDEQIRSSIKRISGRVQPLAEPISEPIAVVCFGPSLADTWEQVKDFKYVMSCSGAHKFLVDKGIIPTWHIEVDPRAHKIQLIGAPQKETEYLIASACHPKLFDHLEGHNVKLWHVFDTGEGSRLLPRGDWAITGGCGVGLRAMTIAAFLGFRNLHIFGMDGCEGPAGNKHAAEHPNEPKKHDLVEYPVGSGKFWKTTQGLLEAARQTFHELDQMPSVKATFYGEGLVQAMAKDYAPKSITKDGVSDIVAFEKPPVISDEMRKLNAQLHQDNLMYGARGERHAETIKSLAEKVSTTSILDYGCGKGLLGKSLPFPIWEYDPAIPEKSESPRPADIVVCTDVLEHVEPKLLNFVLDDLRRCTRKVGYFVVSTRAAVKTYSDGRNTHLIQENAQWWAAKLSEFFEVAKAIEKGDEVHLIVGPRQAKPAPAPAAQVVAESVATVTKDGTSVRFLTTNKMTKFRADTLLTKEPVTINWVNRMTPADILVDVGANIGGYSLWAGKKGARVFAFEPVAQNYATLCANIQLNDLSKKVTGYCAAISDKFGLDFLQLSDLGPGSSCNQLATTGQQGCVTLTLDELVESGKLPQPTHIKIDVDGIEPKVFTGAERTIQKAKEVLVEINEKSPEHNKLVRLMGECGFRYRTSQVNQARRKEGNFKGYAEYLFSKVDDEIEKMIDRIEEAPVIVSPFDHVYIEGIWSPEFYDEIQKNLDVEFEHIGKSRPIKGYADRTVHSNRTAFWNKVHTMMCDGRLRSAVCDKFGTYDPSFSDETLLIQDRPGYKIGPHTDSPAKVITMLFYLPGDDSLRASGTSIYTPKKESLRCVGGPHHPFEDFNNVWTAPFLPNSLFAFKKTDNSFHGVEPFESGIRNTLLYDVRKG